MAQIYIGGDSWGCGEISGKISPGVTRLAHRGIEQLFKDSGHNVNNSSQVGVSNSMSVAALAQSLYAGPLPDYVFWFQTDPLRDLVPYEENFKNKYSTYQQLIDKSRLQITDTYRTLNELGVTVYCLGGCSKLYVDIMSQYSNLVPLVPSVTQLVIPDYPHPELWQSGWIVGHERQFSIDELDLIIADREAQLLLNSNESSLYVKYFQPDGQHLNRLGHRFLFNFLCERLSIVV